jgi:arylsulfatase
MRTTITRRQFMRGVLAGTAAASLRPSTLFADGQDSRPNIVVIMADDMGFSDAGCYGGEIQTPNLDRLAAGGLRFTQFYNCARCCPTRASLMTGQYAHKVGLARNGRSLTRNGMTIAEALKGSGYNTAMVGKWHLSRTPVLDDPKLHQKWLDHQHDPGRPFGPLDTYPVNRGFDNHYGVIWGVIDFFDPFSLVDGTDAVKTVPDDYYFTDAITDKAVEYVQDCAKSAKPFFLYFAHCAPHWPLHARPEDIAKYQSTYTGGWDRLRAERFERQLQMGLFEKGNTPLPPVQTRGATWDALSEEEQAYQARKMAVHAAMVDRVDQSIGRLLQTLEETGELDNTLILFLCDNGASPEVPQRPGYDRTAQTREGCDVTYHDIPLEEMGSEMSYTGIGAPWSSTSNTPFRYWKQESFEGGCHTPLIVHWPRGLKAKSGSVCHEVAHVVDVLPTCLELAGGAYPKTFGGHVLTPLDGKSLAPVLAGRSRAGHETLFFEHVNGRAIRQGDWKLVAFSRTPKKWELYNLAEDQTETQDLADRYPERVEAMKAEWKAWARQVGSDTL